MESIPNISQTRDGGRKIARLVPSSKLKKRQPFGFSTWNLELGTWNLELILEPQTIEIIHQFVEIVLRTRFFPFLPFRDADAQSNSSPTIRDKFLIPLGDRLRQGIDRFAAAEQLAQINLQTADRTDRGPGNRGSLVLRKHDRLFWTDSTTCGAALLTIILRLDEYPIRFIHSINAEQTKIETFEAVRTSAIVDYRIPATIGG